MSAEHELTILAPLRIETLALRRARTSATIITSGMGPKRSACTASELGTTMRHDAPIAIAGVCGALDPSLRAGDVIVATELRSSDGRVVTLGGAELVAGELRARGLSVRSGPLACVDHIVRGAERSALAATGALAVDMESIFLVDALASTAPRVQDGRRAERPVCVIRVVLDTPDQELWSMSTPGNAKIALGVLAETVPSLERWARATGPRSALLAGPRAFCAGVERAIEIVERALDRFEHPIYVRRQIVHNSHVVSGLEARGAVFVEEVDDVPMGARVILAAHGVSPEVRAQAAARDLQVIDATCPLVTKVHTEARRFAEQDYDIVLIGHADHEEVVGTLGEAPANITVVSEPADIDKLQVRDPERVAFLSQTTLAVDEVDELVDGLRARFPAVTGPGRDDICYATQNRQEAVTAVARESDLVLVVGSQNSSNSQRLAEVAGRVGTSAHLIDTVSDIRFEWLQGAATIGISAGASAPEHKVQEVVEALRSLGPLDVQSRTLQTENVIFRLPLEVR